MNFDFTLTDNSAEAMAEFEAKCQRVLEKCGLAGERFAKQLAPVSPGGGNLRNSITHQVREHDAYIGTDNEYAIYQEVGTGIHATLGGGRDTPWLYTDQQGVTHWTRGNRAHPYIKPSVADHVSDYRAIMEGEFKSG